MKDKEKQIVKSSQKAVRKNEDNAGAMTDLLNREMKDKEMIEEMAKKICKSLSHCCMCDDCNYKEITDLDECKSMRIAENLAKNGYRKLPEDSVVLSGEQCVEIVQDNYNIGYERGSKETAEKIITKIKQSLSSVETIVGDTHKLQPEIGYSMREVDDLLDELVKTTVLR